MKAACTLVLVLGVFAMPAANRRATDEPEPLSLTYTVHWEGYGQREPLTGTAVVATETTAGAAIGVMMLETPSGTRAILAHRYEPREGLSAITLRDNASRWRVELESRSGLRLKSAFDVAKFEIPRKMAEAEYPVKLTMRVNGESLAELDSTTRDHATVERLVSAVKESKLSGALHREASRGMLDAILFLEAVADQAGDATISWSTDLIATLTQLFRERPDAHDMVYDLYDWRQTMESAHRGSTPESSEQARFVTRFSSVSQADLLAEVRKRQVRPPQP
jgi:hypothetical protein